MVSTLASRSLIAAVAALLCCRLQLVLATATSTFGLNSTMATTVQGYQHSSVTPTPTTTKAAGPVECGILQESSGGSGDDACRWSSSFYVTVVVAPVVVLTAAVIVTAVLCRRRQLNRQGQENVEAKAQADDKPEGRRKKNDYTGPPIPPVKVQQDPNNIDYSVVPDDGEHIYGNEETVYMNTDLDPEQPAAVACSGGGDGRGGVTFARGTSSDVDEIDNLPLAPLPPGTRGVSKDRVPRAEGGERKAARGPKAGATGEAVGRARRQRTAGGSSSSSSEHSKPKVEAESAGSASRQRAAAAAGGGEPSKLVVEASAAGRVSRQQAAGGGGRRGEPSKPSEEEAAAAARTALAEKLARAMAAKRQQKEMEKQMHDQETEPEYENVRR